VVLGSGFFGEGLILNDHFIAGKRACRLLSGSRG
jgi:hypothetical protein